MYYEATLSLDRMQANGSSKRVTEKYIVDALTVSEAEARINSELKPLTDGDFQVTSVKKTKISEIFNLDSEFFYLVKCGFIQLDEKSGTEKRAISEFLVGSSGFDDAVKVFKNNMKDTVSDYEIVSVAETAILEVFPIK